MNKLFISLLFLIVSSNAFSAHYYRFWRGYKKETMTESNFIKGLNDIFVPVTIKQGKNKGLLSYMPVLSPKNRPLNVPVEMALVVYKSEEDYRTLRNTEEGQAYGKLHWDYFEKGISKSKVPTLYSGTIALEEAYDVLGSDKNWQNGHPHYKLSIRKDGVNDDLYINSLKRYVDKTKKELSKKGLDSYIVLIGDKHVIEYFLWENHNAMKAVENNYTLAARPKTLAVLQSSNLSKKEKVLSYSQGLNIQFK
jgi:hypothetical protein